MIQKKYLCKDLKATDDAIDRIGEVLQNNPHKSAVVTIYEKGFTTDRIETLTKKIRALGESDLRVAGISCTIIAELLPEGCGINMNLILSEDSDIDVITVPCEPGGENEAADMLRNRLDSYKDLKAVELFGSNMTLNTTGFMERAMEGHEDAVLFGTTTLRNLAQKVSVEETEIVVETDDGPDKDEFIIGDGIVRDGFVAVVFAGKDLRVHADYALGWNPIGRKFPVQLGENELCGETMIKTINDLPAVDIYREYLGVYPDEYLISNICEFPLVVEREGINICMIPLFGGNEGELYFMMSLHPDEQLRFTFASHDEVLYASRKSLERMESFGPDALFLTLCGNRISFLKEDAHIEWDEFGQISPEHVVMHGACELFYHNKKGGILNSAHLAIGLKEGEDKERSVQKEHPSLESLRHGRTLSLSDRMSTFLGKITTELVDIALEARDANKAKSAFLSHMSHEIRTPINAILGMDEMILQDSKEKDTLDYAESIRSAGNNLLGIVNDILDFSKIEAGKMNIVPAEYEITSLINDLYNVVRLRAEEKGLRVKLDIDPGIPSVLMGDETRIRQIITNLLTNAVKYTESGTVTLCMKCTPVDDTDVRSVCLSVSVRDTGIGIRPEDMDRLSEEYERFDEKRNHKTEGTGLGLSITTELLELMGSRLSVSSTYGEGSEFGFELIQGVVKDEPVGDKSTWFREPAGRRQRVVFTAEDASILVVDDYKVNLTVIKNLLKKTKIKVDTAGSGEEALKMVSEKEYDVIFLDHLMPDMDGPETLKRMKELADNKCPDVPVISLTANVLAGAREEYLQAGYTDYLSKPIKFKELEDMLFYYIPPEKIRTVNNI